jgi:tetratricopeptide (TPR) repeat protein
VTDFLVRLFEAPADGEVPGNQLTARQLLDRGARRASRDLANQPLLQGRILHTVGKAYTALGLYDEARNQLNDALAARVRTDGPVSLPVAETEVALGDAAASHGEYDAADGHYARAMTIREKLLGRDHPLVARVAFGLGALR